MSMDFNGRESDKPITDQEGVMFAAQPVWERNRKKKGFGARKAAAPAATVVAPEPRTFAAERDYEEPLALDRPLDTPARDYPRTEYAAMSPGATTTSTLASDADAGLVAPIGISRGSGVRSTRSAKSSSVAPAAIAAAVVGLGALGATGWYMSRDTSGVPELTAGSTTSEVAAAPLVPTDPPAQLAANDVPPPPAPAPVAETPRAAPPAARTTARARPAAAASAGETGVNASTTAAIPDAPQPYSATPGTAAPTQVNPPLIVLPPSNAAPAAIPATPPTVTPEPAPTTAAPTPETATPPQ